MHIDEPDTILVLAAQSGDKEAFGVLIDRHRPLLLAMCRRTLADSVAAEDAAHEAVLQALLSLDSVKRPDRFGAWLAGIGLNICRQWLRERSRSGRSWEAMNGAEPVLDPDDLQSQPEVRAEAADLAARVRQAVDGLPDGQRAAINLFYVSDRTYAETAQLLGIEVGTVKKRLHKARRTLRRRLHTLWKEETMASAEAQPVELRVIDVRKEADESPDPTEKYVVVLEEVGGVRRLLIWIGKSEGVALALLLENEEMPRPLTIAFTANLVRSLEGKLREVRISRLDQEVFYAVARLEGPHGDINIDARPSDALALALSLGAPIRAEPAVLSAVAVTPDQPGGRYGAPKIVTEARETWQKTRSATTPQQPA